MRTITPLLAVVLAGLVLAGCGGSLLPRETNVNSAKFLTYDEVEAAFASIVPQTTKAADLAALGFDVKTVPNVEVLTYIGVGDRFLLPGSKNGSHVPPQVLACIDVQDRCSANVFHLRHIESHHVGNTLLDLTGFEKHVIDSGWSADVLVVLRDGVVVYKIMSGRPRIEDAHDSVHPLGPLQNMGNVAP